MSAARTPTRRTARAAAAGTAAALGLLLAVPAAQAAPAGTVDPALMVPTLNPDYAPYTCWEAGSGIICTGTDDIAYDEPFGLQCDGQDVWLSGVGTSTIKRWHTADGRATRTQIFSSFPRDVFSLSPTGEGPSFVVRARFNSHYTYAVPGERSSRTLTETGALLLGRSGTGGPLLVHDAGAVRFATGNEDEITFSGGQHDFYDDMGSLDRAICDTLT